MYIYIYIHTHTHTHIYTYTYVCEIYRQLWGGSMHSEGPPSPHTHPPHRYSDGSPTAP